MPEPTPEVYQRSIGRHGEFTFRARFTSADNDNLSDVPVLSRNYLSGAFNDARFAVTSIKWMASAGISAVVEFDSVPPSPEGMVLSITPDASSGCIDFESYPNGNKSDTNRDNPGDLVVTTQGALPGDELFLSGTYIEKGTTNPGAA